MYLPTKKIGKNNPEAEEIKADNNARINWNRTADVALISGIAEAKILEIKKEESMPKLHLHLEKAAGNLPCFAPL